MLLHALRCSDFPYRSSRFYPCARVAKPTPSFSAQCTSFALSNCTYASVIATTYFAANDPVIVSSPTASINLTTLPAFCRVQLRVVTNATAGTAAQTEVWLPDDWNGRFLTVGNGGYGGGVTVDDLGYVALPQGFAGLSTDTGHVSTASNASWALNNDNAIIDWAWRALKLSIDAGKQVVEQYYGRPQSKSYFLGCSTGGRQGLTEVQRFPHDFDGVLIGSPANYESHLQAWGLHTGNLVLPNTTDNPRWIPAATWAGLIHTEVLRQCDSLDGVADGILNDPTACHFDPAPITCSAGAPNTTACLNAEQAAAVTEVFQDYVLPDGTFVFDGYYPGGEATYASGGYVASKPNVYALDWFQYFVFNDTTWDPSTLDEYAIKLADELDPGRTNALETDLSAFAGPSHGGKILHYVGLADQLISPGWSKRYHAEVAETMQQKYQVDVDAFYRFFTVPGMQHCRGGLGPNGFGGSRQASVNNPPLSHDPQHDILQALVAWVEQEQAPTKLIGAYYVNNTVANGVQFTRPICKWPLQSKYLGGDPNVESSFECA